LVLLIQEFDSKLKILICKVLLKIFLALFAALREMPFGSGLPRFRGIRL
jgi:hypothetical protein